MAKKTKQQDVLPQGSRGDVTRMALINAGIELFGEYGFNGTATRMLAKQANVNISAISYYFENKEGLYTAVLTHVAQSLSDRTLPIRKATQQILSNGTPSRQAALEGLQHMINGFTELFTGSGPIRMWSKIVLREQSNPTSGFAILYDVYLQPHLHLMTRLIGICTDMPPESTEVKIRTQAFLGQLLGFLIAREVLLRHLGVPQLEESHIALIKSVLQANLQAYLTMNAVHNNETIPTSLTARKLI